MATAHQEKTESELRAEMPPPVAERVPVSPKRKIFYLVDSLNIGGTETQAVELARRMDPQQYEVTLACQGRVEGRSETVEVGAAADGVIQTVYVKEGERVAKGAKLAEIGCPLQLTQARFKAIIVKVDPA